jgi:citrate lyase subunit beta/citryl-CoA lyase
VLDGVYNSIGDEAGFRAECEQGRLLGMDGKTLIHPNQIALCNAVFSPGGEEVAWARKIIDAFALPENAGKGVIMVEGRMTEIMHADMARRTVAIVEMIGEMDKPA